MTQLSLLGGLEYPKPIATISLETLFTAIQTGVVTFEKSKVIKFAEPSHSAFEFYNLEGKSSKYVKCKKELPMFMPGTFHYRNAQGFRTHAGIIVTDFDDLANVERVALSTRLVCHETTLAVYNTPSGLRSLHQVTPVPTKAEEHAYVYDMLINQLIADKTIVEGQADPASRQVHRGYILYQDKNMYRHDAGISDVAPLVWEPADVARQEKQRIQQEEAEKRETAERIEAQKQAREKRRKELKSLSAKAVAEGGDKKSLDEITHILSQPSPLSAEAINDIDAVGYLETEGIIDFTGNNRGGRKEFHHPGADSPRSGTVSDDDKVITVFSSTLLAKLPVGLSAGAAGVNINAQRAAIWFATGKDIKRIGNASKEERDALARDIYHVFGVGCNPDDLAHAWKRKREIENKVDPKPATSDFTPKQDKKNAACDKGRLLKPTAGGTYPDEAPVITSEAYPIPEFPREILSQIPIFRDYLDAWDGHSECPLEYHFACLKTFIGAMLGRVAYINEALPLYPNNFVALLGPAGFSRKSTAMSSLEYYIASRVDPNVHIEGSVNSAEGVGNTFALPDGLRIGERIPAEYLADDNDDDATQKKKIKRFGMARKVDLLRLNEMLAQTYHDEGFRVLAIVDELASLLQKSKNTSTANVLSALNTLYNMPRRIENNSVSNPMVAHYPCLSVLTGIPTATFKKYVGTSEAGSGFASRFEYYVVEDTIDMAISAPPNSVKIDKVVDGAEVLRDSLLYQTAFDFTPDAVSYLEDIYSKQKRAIMSKDVDKQGTQARFDTQLRKNALIFSAIRSVIDDDEGSDTCYKITIHDLKIAKALTDYLIACNDHVFHGVSETRMEETETRLLHYIRRGYHSAAELRWKVRKDAETVKRALDALVAVSTLVTESTQRTVKYYLNNDDEGEA